MKTPRASNGRSARTTLSRQGAESLMRIFRQLATVGAFLLAAISLVRSETMRVKAGGTEWQFLFFPPANVNSAVYSEIAWQFKAKAGFNAFSGNGNKVFLTQSFSGYLQDRDGVTFKNAGGTVSYDRSGAIVYSSHYPTDDVFVGDTYLVDYYGIQHETISDIRTETNKEWYASRYSSGEFLGYIYTSYSLSDEFLTSWLIEDVELAPFNFTGTLTNTAKSAFRTLDANERTYTVAKLHYQMRVLPGSTGKLTWLEVFTPENDPTTPADESKDKEYTFMSWGIPTGTEQSPVYAIDPLGLDPLDQNPAKRHPTRNGTYDVVFSNAQLTVDANRDGTIKLASEDASDATSAAQPYRFWLNDDNDSGGDINGDDTPGSSTPDGQQVKVQGTRDLVDFFPVFLDLKQLLTALPPGASVKYKLKQADDGLRFVYADLARADAFKYLKDYATGNSLKEADAHWVTAAGYELDATWLGQVKDADKGVILVEGRNATDKPLVLSVEKADGTVMAEVKLELKIVPVETMFRHLNLHDRNLAGLVGTKEDSAQPEAMGDPTGFPDNPNSDSRWLIFVHGFNVSGQKSRGWNAEMFKRTYWSGNKSRFVGVSWFGNPDPGSLGLPADYHLSMRNAMVTAPVLAQAINALPGSAGTKTMFAHSLGCGVISSAIADHGMTVGRVCFVDAALARECFDGRDPGTFTAENDGMTPAVWKPYSPGLYAANWFARFDPTTDARGTLTWNNRFSGVSSNVYHFYSSTEDVLAEYTGELPSTLGGIAWDSGLHGSFGWVYQEKGKGNRQNYGLGGPPLTHLGSYYGGWGMNIKDPVLSGDTPYWKWVSSDTYIGRVIKTPAEIGTVSDSVLRRHPVFEPGWGVVRNQEQQETPVSNVSPVDGAPSWIYDLYLGATGNTLAANSDNRAQLLAEAIPSLTWCMGSRKSESGIPSGRNFNLPTLVDQSNWPRGKPDGVTPEWRHSDMREVAYLYQYGVFDKIVELSKP